MKLSENAIGKIKGSIRLRNMLALEMDRHFATIIRWIDENAPNGDLTTAKALQLISQETGLSQSEILEEDSVPTESQS